MYQSFKNILTYIVPRKFLFEQEENFRSLYSVFYNGNKYQCPICQKKLKKFISTSYLDLLCPNCGSLRRNRRLWYLLKTEFLKKNSVVLDFSPSRCLYRKLKKTDNITYHSTDLSGDFIADNQFDITNLKMANDTYDLILCYHILEHIPDDSRAINELFRVMKSGGKALLQTPFREGEIYEDLSITSKKDRLNHFGQADHVRIYSVKGLRERVEKSGFQVEIRTNFNDTNNYGFDKNETILVLTKPLNP